ncbi:MAG: GNAT family N-acetyltransferase [Chloroflexales bacterium]|nr:GNAT family N-acetyltransferase [Chloroflexales bacterium]
MERRAEPRGETLGIDARGRGPITVRRLTPRDRMIVAALLCRLSDTTWGLRYMRPLSRSAAQIAAETERIAGGDQSQRMVLLAVVGGAHGEQVVAIAELVCDQDKPSGELAIVVSDEEQRQGIGRALVRRLASEARARGLTSLRIDTLAENRAMLALIRGLGAPQTVDYCRGEVRVVVDLRLWPPLRRPNGIWSLVNVDLGGILL